jgi:hypothetical protein
MERQVSTTDTCGSGATISLQNIAVDNNLTLTEQAHIARSSQTPADQPLNFDSATALLSFGSFTINTIGR